jgi:hypothetical protein
MQPLRSLKQSATQHLLSDPHKLELVVAAEEKGKLQRHRNSGLALGRLALQTIREGSSHVQFEGKVLDCHLNGGGGLQSLSGVHEGYGHSFPSIDRGHHFTLLIGN